MDKNSEAHSPNAKFNFFQLTYSYCGTIVWIYNNKQMKIKGITQRARKGRKRPENDVTSTTIY